MTKSEVTRLDEGEYSKWSKEQLVRQLVRADKLLDNLRKYIREEKDKDNG